MGLKPIKTRSLIKQALRIRRGLENHEGKRQGQAKDKFIELSMVEKSLKTHATEVKIRVEQGSFNKEQSSVVSTKESKGKTNENECLIENHESFIEEQVEEKKNEIEKSEETKEEMSSILFEGDKREETKESCCDISLLLNSLSSEEFN
ncbi:hypothetical protein M9H77_21839 [Catharanthus roseus]|uniref:Uncharacterized protein n=1 Tax=Catharanthus roseus TaxID=4058 RepID=A0ACC0AP63_CATRO|nr:hypothetical protein M9H77_21839 [Catharanthus roseus]